MDFSVEAMNNLAKEDALIQKMINDFLIKGIDLTEACKITYNSEVLPDPVMMDAYRVIN